MGIGVIHSLVATLFYVITQNQQDATLAANVNPATLLDFILFKLSCDIYIYAF